MQRTFRTRLLIDPKLQGALVCRVLLYWCLSIGVMMLLAGLQVVWRGPNVESGVALSRAVLAFGPALLASMVLLPFVAFDTLRFSHRFAGPMHRLRTEARRLADGETVEPVNIREKDYWGDLADEFNRVAEELNRLRATEGAPELPAEETAGAGA